MTKRRLALSLVLAALSAWPVVGLAQSAPSRTDGGTPAAKKPLPLKGNKSKAQIIKESLEFAEEMPTSVPKKFTWDIPQVIERVEVPGLEQGMGVPVKLHAVRSKLPLVDLMQHMQRSFEDGMLYIPPEGHITKLTSDPLITGYDPWRQIGFTVIFQENPDGTTTAILGEAHMSERVPTTGTYFAPIFPGAQGTIQSKSESSQMIAYATSAPEPQVHQFYRDQLGKAGYTEYQPMRFRKGGEQLVIQYNPNPQLANGVVVSRLPYSDDGLSTAPSPK